MGAGSAAEGAIAGAVTLVVVERHRRDLLPLDVLPDVELGPIEQRVNPDVGPRRELGLVLVPELRRLIAHIPEVLDRAGREIALLGAAPLFVGPHAGDDAGEGLPVGIGLVFAERVIVAVPGP